MANYTTGSERYNNRMRKIFDNYEQIKIKESKMSYKELIADGYSKETARHIIKERLAEKRRARKK
jgi:hypothetical protein